VSSDAYSVRPRRDVPRCRQNYCSDVREAGQVAPSPRQYQSRTGSLNSPFTRTWYHHAWWPAPLYVKQKAIHDLDAPAGAGDDAVAPHCLKYRMTSSRGCASGNQFGKDFLAYRVSSSFRQRARIAVRSAVWFIVTSFLT